MSSIVIPSRESDSGPLCPPDDRSPHELVNAAEDALHSYYSKTTQERDLRILWLNEAIRLLERALLIEEDRK